MQTQLGQLEVSYTSRGVARYSLEIWHDGLNKHRVIRGETSEIVELKAQLQVQEWNGRWSIVNARQRQNSDHEQRRNSAALRTAEAVEESDRLTSLLKQTLKLNDALDWDALKDKRPFPEPQPELRAPPLEVEAQPQLPREPDPTDLEYRPTLGVLDRLIPSRRQRIISGKLLLFQANHSGWKVEVERLTRSHAEAVRDRREEIERQLQNHEKELRAWKKRETAYLVERRATNIAVDVKRTAYELVDPQAVEEYCDLVLSASQYPDYFPQEFELDYNPSTKTVIVDYVLPAPEALPTLKNVKYIANRDDFEEQHIAPSQAAKLYDEVLYQVVLRTVHELLEADTAQALEAVVFNGIVTSIDRRSGKPVTACVLSLRAGRSEFLAIDLAQVDPRACFKALKGVGSAKLHGLSPVPPIMPLRRDDGRFVSSYEVANTLDSSVNLAEIDWEDFEHLIREVFEQEFSKAGGEVKVTRTSRDGGVDAIAFDPDPIRGGKIVIQAKRYNSTVSVGAVRDLYGTVVNEGAIKGILVTTSDYGPDSYSFANGKPLVLLNGANLLHMLERHGHRARIDLNEAKRKAAMLEQGGPRSNL